MPDAPTFPFPAMKTLSFTTNITTADGVAAVTEPLNVIEAIDGWILETEAPNHLLTVQTIYNRIAEQVRQAVAQAGYHAE